MPHQLCWAHRACQRLRDGQQGAFESNCRRSAQGTGRTISVKPKPPSWFSKSIGGASIRDSLPPLKKTWAPCWLSWAARESIGDTYEQQTQSRESSETCAAEASDGPVLPIQSHATACCSESSGKLIKDGPTTQYSNLHRNVDTTPTRQESGLPEYTVKTNRSADIPVGVRERLVQHPCRQERRRSCS